MKNPCTAAFQLCFPVLTLLCGATTGFTQTHEHDPGDPIRPEDLPEGEVIVVPPKDDNLATYAIRQYAQEQTLWRFEVFHDFRFTNQLKDSGIDFLHRIVDDCG